MRWMRERLNKEEGFTLIELMVVVLIIAVLVAIAIPSFLGFRNRAEDRSAQADLRNALLAEKAYWTDEGEYTVTAANLNAYEPSLLVNITGAADDGVFLEIGTTTDEVCLSQESGSGNHFMIYENATAGGGTFYGSSAAAITCPDGTAIPPVEADVTWAATSFQAVP